MLEEHNYFVLSVDSLFLNKVLSYCFYAVASIGECSNYVTEPACCVELFAY